MGTTASELRDRLDEQRADLSRDLEAIGDRVSPGRMVERRKAAVRDRMSRAREAVMGTASAGTSAVGDRALGVADTVRQAPDAVVSRAEGNPMAAGIVAFGAGLLAAALIPGTRRESQMAQMAQPHLEKAATGAATLARESAEHLKPAAQEHAQELTEHVREAAGDVKGQAASTAATVKDEATSAAQDVRSSTSGS